MADYTNLTTREIAATSLATNAGLVAMGLKNVFDADTADAPQDVEFPFFVMRWYDTQDGLGHVTRRPFDLWLYLKGEDRTLGERMCKAGMDVLTTLEPGVKLDGSLFQFEDKFQGPDLYDEVYAALVISRHGLAVASGV